MSLRASEKRSASKRGTSASFGVFPRRLCRAWLDGTPDGKASKDIRRSGNFAAAAPRDIPLRRVYRATYAHERFLGRSVFMGLREERYLVEHLACQVRRFETRGKARAAPLVVGRAGGKRPARKVRRRRFLEIPGDGVRGSWEVARRAGPELGVSPRSGREDAPSATEGTVESKDFLDSTAPSRVSRQVFCVLLILGASCEEPVFFHLPSERRCSGRGKDARRRKAGDVVSLRVPSLTREHRMRQNVGTGMCGRGGVLMCVGGVGDRDSRPAANADGKEGK